MRAFDPTRAARHVWRAVYPDEPWPKGWSVAWGDSSLTAADACGLTVWDRKTILLERGGNHSGGIFDTLVHEFEHVRRDSGSHNAKFVCAVKKSLHRLHRIVRGAESAQEFRTHAKVRKK
jgi:hypothetical protein